ncbi:MAG: type III pantothenate kinase [Pseudomonadales bacterium]|nr:type III pantothenate kinase [Pseudomonadales bacterium]
MPDVVEPLVLEIDLGNSFAKWRVRAAKQVLLSEVVPVQQLHATDMLAAAARFKVAKVSICSVASCEINQLLTAKVLQLWELQAEYFTVQSRCAGVVNSYADPTKMGADRWLATIAAKHLYPETEVCIFDCGTAINVEFLSAGAVHLGGYIIPGLAMMQQSLLANTAQVYCSAERLSLEPGLDTGTNVANGSLMAAVALLDKLQVQMQQKSGLLLLTGGGAKGLVGYNSSPNIRYLPDLVLDGFRFL